MKREKQVGPGPPSLTHQRPCAGYSAVGSMAEG